MKKRPVVLHGDCRAVMRTLAPNSIDACVTDPPYHLTSIVKRFGGANAAPAKFGTDGAFARASRGFMGKAWDGGDIAFQADTWREVYRVMKPGAHLLAFGGTRTYHRMACAIEDAGFEIRDCIQWLYGSGFPKSHDVSKGIDKVDAVEIRRTRALQFTAWIRSTGLTTARIDEITNTNMGGHYTTAASQPAVATRDLFEMLRQHFRCAVPKWIEAMVDERTVESENFKRRELLAKVNGTRLAVAPGQGKERGDLEIAVTAAHTDAARQWDGWGTALKPANEPIVLARKPLSEATVAANVLRWGVGALNIDACRVGVRDRPKVTDPKRTSNTYGAIDSPGGKLLPDARWPANVIHDGSDEVVAGFPKTTAATSRTKRDFKGWQNVGHLKNDPVIYKDGGGTAARFFYCAKASRAERAGSKHPTIKPIKLMRYLVRLVTPPGGRVLDPFAGSGTTAQAAIAEGMAPTVIERERVYVRDIQRRLRGQAKPSQAKRRRVFGAFARHWGAASVQSG